MVACKASGLLLSSSFASSGSSNGKVLAILQARRTKLGSSPLRLPKLKMQSIEEVKIAGKKIETRRNGTEDDADSITITKLYALAEAVADRVEMHSIIAEQRADWNKLLLNSINAITLTAATMAGLSAMPAAPGASFLAFKLSSTVLYSAATGLLLVMNKMQPSQLAEEQRNAARLFRQLYTQIQTILAIGNPSPADADQTMEKILALDKAYPLPLLPGMLDKFPKTVEPTVWWPELQQSQTKKKANKNGWSAELEEELREVLQVLKEKDVAEYVRLSKLVLKVNRILAFSGPLLTGLGAIGAAFTGSSSVHDGSWPALLGVAAGALATVLNTLEHGGQVGMVFEMYRNSGGFYHLLEESIRSTLKEEDVGKRENGEVFEMKVALQLGRSLSELRNLASSSHEEDKGTSPEFAGKLF
ncbi:probable F-box protein At4g22030 [Aristolochia californica]|uniref:probable F-box protein At4g22030 n=1 Tax=Aristolochia californica TaxID=171875 RepID=UPI0035D8A1BE